MKEITGKVTKVGKVRDYGQEANWGRDWIHNFKFFMEIDSEEHGMICAMVECKADDTQWGFKIPTDADRQKPFVGDKVKITTHRLQENGAKWASVTWNQSYKIIKKDKKARKERDTWVAEQKKLREDKKQKKQEEFKQNIIDSKLETLGEVETQKNDERLPKAVRDVMNKTFNFDTVLGLLRATVWWVTPEGEGGKQCYHYPPCGCGYPGTGLRRPGGVLHGHPATVRKSILTKAINSGLIIETKKGYKATELGIKTLVGIDTCPECGELRKPVSTYSHYSTQRYSKTTHHGATYHCKHEIDETYKGQQGCNTGTSFKNYKNTEGKLTKIKEIAGVKSSTPATPVFQRVIKERGKRIIQVTKEEREIIEKSSGRLLSPEEHKKLCKSTKKGLPTSCRAMLVCPDCGKTIIGSGIGAGMEVPNTKYRIIEED